MHNQLIILGVVGITIFTIMPIALCVSFIEYLEWEHEILPEAKILISISVISAIIILAISTLIGKYIYHYRNSIPQEESTSFIKSFECTQEHAQEIKNGLIHFLEEKDYSYQSRNQILEYFTRGIQSLSKLSNFHPNTHSININNNQKVDIEYYTVLDNGHRILRFTITESYITNKDKITQHQLSNYRITF